MGTSAPRPWFRTFAACRYGAEMISFPAPMAYVSPNPGGRTCRSLVVKPDSPDGVSRPSVAEDAGPDVDPSIRSSLGRPVRVTFPVDNTIELNRTDYRRLLCDADRKSAV